jgi:alpha-1,3-glucosyltransferase
MADSHDSSQRIGAIVQAILTVLLPLSVMALKRHQEALLFFRLSAIGLYALFPLFTHPREFATKALFYLAYMRFVWLVLKFAVPNFQRNLTRFDRVAAAGLFVVFTFAEIVHPCFLQPRGIMEFLPLMLTSVWCGAWVLLCWCTSALTLLSDVRILASVVATPASSKKSL